MKAYKGFKTDMTCRGFQFEEGKEYHEDSAVLCNSGFHACEAPLDCFGYYSPAESVYHEVELDEVSDERESDSKICGKNIKIGARLNIANLCKLHFDYVKSHCTNKYNAEKGKAATAGESGAATAGYRGAATAGTYGAATAGNYGAATSRGNVAVGDNGVALCRGNDIKARGGLGSILVIAVENEDSYDIKEWKAEVVDGKKIKADTWYKLENGEFVEVEDETP